MTVAGHVTMQEQALFAIAEGQADAAEVVARPTKSLGWSVSSRLAFTVVTTNFLEYLSV